MMLWQIHCISNKQGLKYFPGYNADIKIFINKSEYVYSVKICMLSKDI